MKIICYYHNDPDGIVSAAIVKKYHKKDDVELIACDYGMDNPIFLDCDRCYVVDFSFDAETMQYLYNKYKTNFIWLDHHISAKERNPDLWEDAIGERSLNNSGCMLTWDFLFPSEEAPRLVKWVEDLDLWKWEYKEYSKPFVEAFYRYYKEPDERVINLLDDETELIDTVLEKGEVMIDIQDSHVKSAFEKGIDVNWEDYKTRIINSDQNASQIGEYCYKEKEYPIALIWHIRGRQVIVGLRSNTIDVGSIAKKYGGGGHKFASGFTTDISFIENILKK